MDISTLETKVTEECLLHAEDILERDDSIHIREEVSGKYETIVIDNNFHFTPIIEIKSDRLIKCSCNCNTREPLGVCSHVLASIIQIRKQIVEPKNEGTKITKSKRSRTQSDIRQLISKIPENELQEFVFDRTRSNKNFKLIFQARFLEFMDQNEIEPFIESIFPPLTKANEKVSGTRLNAFVEVSREIENHFKNLVLNDDLIEAFKLSYLHLKKSFYIKCHLKLSNLKFERLHDSLLGNFLEIFQLIEAPEYKEYIKAQLESLLKSSYISASTKKERQIWLLFLTRSLDKSRLISISHNYLRNLESNNYDSLYFIKTIEIIAQTNDEQLINLIVQKDSQETYRIIHFLKEYRHFPECNKALLFFYLYKDLNQPLSLLVTEHVNVDGKYLEQTSKRTIDYFLKYSNTKFVFFLERINGSFQKFESSLIELTKSRSDIFLLVDLYFTLRRNESAIDIIKENLSWNILQRFDKILLDINSETCQELYWHLLKKFLQDHFGRQASEFIEDVFRRLRYLNKSGWINILKSRVKHEYPGRKFRF